MKCVEENRDRGEIKNTKGEENVAEKKWEKRERVNCKLYPWSVGLFEFYIKKFQKFDFTHWNLVPLAIHTPQLVSAVSWHITMLTCFIFAKSTQKLWKIMADLAQ